MVLETEHVMASLFSDNLTVDKERDAFAEATVIFDWRSTFAHFLLLKTELRQRGGVSLRKF